MGAGCEVSRWIRELRLGGLYGLYEQYSLLGAVWAAVGVMLLMVSRQELWPGWQAA